jgi:DNA-binding IclR family transcriptional regulator
MVDARPDTVQIKSVGTMFEILNEIQERNAAGVSELAESLGLAKSTVHNHLMTLSAYEYVRRDGNEFRVGIRFLDHGGHARANLTGHEIIKKKIREVADETGELVQYLVEEHGRGVVALREPGDQAVRTKTRLGRRVYLHHLSAGKAILAHMPPDRVDEVIERHGLPPKTDQTITDPESLRDHLDQIRRQGYVFDKEEHIKGLCSLGVPVTLGPDRVIGAMSIAGPPHRVEHDTVVEEFVQLLTGVANEIELNLTY